MINKEHLQMLVEVGEYMDSFVQGDIGTLEEAIEMLGTISTLKKAIGDAEAAVRQRVLGEMKDLGLTSVNANGWQAKYVPASQYTALDTHKTLTVIKALGFWGQFEEAGAIIERERSEQIRISRVAK